MLFSAIASQNQQQPMHMHCYELSAVTRFYEMLSAIDTATNTAQKGQHAKGIRQVRASVITRSCVDLQPRKRSMLTESNKLKRHELPTQDCEIMRNSDTSIARVMGVGCATTPRSAAPLHCFTMLPTARAFTYSSVRIQRDSKHDGARYIRCLLWRFTEVLPFASVSRWSINNPRLSCQLGRATRRKLQNACPLPACVPSDRLWLAGRPAFEEHVQAWYTSSHLVRATAYKSASCFNVCGFRDNISTEMSPARSPEHVYASRYCRVSSLHGEFTYRIENRRKLYADRESHS